MFRTAAEIRGFTDVQLNHLLKQIRFGIDNPGCYPHYFLETDFLGVKAHLNDSISQSGVKSHSAPEVMGTWKVTEGTEILNVDFKKMRLVLPIRKGVVPFQEKQY